VKIVEFVLSGQPFIAMSAGPLDPFNHAVSFVVNCDDQAELDRTWNALLEGGSAEQCGWLKDRFGLSWQIVPTVLGQMMADPDRIKAKRAADAMLKMVKIDIAVLQAAFAGTLKPVCICDAACDPGESHAMCQSQSLADANPDFVSVGDLAAR